MAISTDTSAYAVWKDFGKEKIAVVNGPPVEWGAEEEEYMRRVGGWFEGLNEEVREDLGRWPEKKGKDKAVDSAGGVEEEGPRGRKDGKATGAILKKVA